MQRFKGKRIVVTGATSGIGYAGALRLAKEGAHVIATGRHSPRLHKTRQNLPESALVVPYYAEDPDSALSLAQHVASQGSLDGIWLNAGFANIGGIGEVDVHHFDTMMSVNVRGPVLLMAQLIPLLKNGASIVVTGSTSAYEGSAMASIYAATKGALLALVRSWASALGPQGIRVNTLVPGPIDTAFRDFMLPTTRQTFEADVRSRLALPYIGNADEAAAVALFLLSDDARFVTGSQYAVDGGLVMQ